MGETITPQMYGAKGDGKTDDTKAFQKAVDSGYDVYIPTSNGETYLVTNTITIKNTKCKRIFSETISRTGSTGIIANFLKCADPKTTPLFDVQIQLLRISGLQVLCKADDHRQGLFINAMNENICDYDIRIEHSSIKNFYRVAKFQGRGFEILNSNISSCQYLADFYWDNAKDSNANHPAQYDQRGICVKNCRLHNIASAFFIVRSGHAYGFHFEGNTVDNGAGYLIRAYEQAYGWNISGNVIQGIQGEFPVMDFRKGMQNCIITGNTFISDSEYWIGREGTVDSWIKSSGNTRSSIISNNVFKNSESFFMSFSNIEGTSIVGNAMHNTRSTNERAIITNSNCHKNCFVGNTLVSKNNIELFSSSMPKDNSVIGNYS